MKDKISDIFFYTDEFCKEYYKIMEGFQLVEETGKRTRNKPCKLSDSPGYHHHYCLSPG